MLFVANLVYVNGFLKVFYHNEKVAFYFLVETLHVMTVLSVVTRIVMEVENLNDVNFLLKELKRNSLEGLDYQRLLRFEAQLYLEKKNELKAIYNLTESHAPGMREPYSLKANTENSKLYALNIVNPDLENGILLMLKQLSEMPKEWTLVQLTPQYNPSDQFNLNTDKINTPALHVTVFNCGKKQINPFTVNIPCPVDKLSGKNIELIQEMHDIVKSSKSNFLMAKNQKKGPKTGCTNPQTRSVVDNRTKNLIQDVQNIWLQEWRCLFVGKLVDESLELKVAREVKEYLRKEIVDIPANENILPILMSVAKSSGYGNLSSNDIGKAVKNCFPNLSTKLLKKVVIFMRSVADKYALHIKERHPVILIVDDKLDIIPWEMIDVLDNQAVSRIPSFHFAYFLYNEHKENIKGGHKIVTKYEEGTYVVNPDEDLKDMEIRIMNFFNYWCPGWTGISGYKPDEDEFYELLISSEIFSYNGHGSGSQHLITEKLLKVNVKAVVMLFGCSSTKFNYLGPQVEYDSTKYSNYLLSGCPCVVGALWEVPDRDTDILTTEFLSHWIPSKSEVHWKNVDKTQWILANPTVKFFLDKTKVPCDYSLEPQLSMALNMAKKDCKYWGTRAAFVVRGLPVKIVILNNM